MKVDKLLLEHKQYPLTVTGVFVMLL